MNSFLTKLRLPALVNHRSDFYSPDEPSNPNFLPDYPYPVSYNFNSRGYRDNEWPDDLQNVVWCVGDSATVGIGVPFEHSWPSVLSRQIEAKCINISMRGASNQWIARQIYDLIDSAVAKILVIQWSYLHRRERSLTATIDELFLSFYNDIKDPKWPKIGCFDHFFSLPEFIQQEILAVHKFEQTIEDKKVSLWNIIQEENFAWLDHVRCQQHDYTDTDTDIDFTLAMIDTVEAGKNKCQIVHSFVPEFLDRDQGLKFETKFEQRYGSKMIYIEQMDYARDGALYDLITASSLVHNIINRLRIS